jgi:hypothetical protein
MASISAMVLEVNEVVFMMVGWFEVCALVSRAPE